jgi:hypothetical protein
VAALLEHETLDGKEVVEIFGPGHTLDLEAGVEPQQPATIEAVIVENGRKTSEETGDGPAEPGVSLAPAGAGSQTRMNGDDI